MTTTAGRPRSDLALRLISAAVLIPAALFVVWAGGWWLAVGCAVFAAIMSVEWSIMTKRASHVYPIAMLAAAASLAVIPFGWTAGAGIVAAGAVVSALLVKDRLSACLGFLYTAVPPLCLFLLREGAWDGRSAALIFMSTVWASDAAAYFAGRGFGGPSLSPKDSPHKTWSGAIGAVLSTTLCGLTAAGLVGGSYVVWLIVGASVSIVAQLGDHFESVIKRRFGVKDTGSIMPGHGGLLDRVDGLGAVCVVTLAMFIIFPNLVSLLGLV